MRADWAAHRERFERPRLNLLEIKTLSNILSTEAVFEETVGFFKSRVLWKPIR